MNARPGDIARLYHRLSSYGPSHDDEQPVPDHPLMVRDFVANDVTTWPAQHKLYGDGLPVVALPREWPRVDTHATAVLAGRAAEPARPSLAALARVLYLSAGVVRTSARSHGRTVLFRAAGSAGGRFPLEVYVAARDVEGLPDGVHWYDPVAHALRQVGPPAADGATTLIVTGIPWRAAWRYTERAFRHLYWDGGTMLAQALALAESGGLRPRLYTRFPDAEVARVVGADGVQEFGLALVALGGDPATRAGGEAATGDVDHRPAPEFPLITAAQRAGDMDTLGDPWPQAAPLETAPPASPDLDTVILQRGSTRIFDAAAAVARETFAFMLEAALRGSRVPHFVAVHGVDGLEPGLYRWPDLQHPRRREPLRQELLSVCWDQDLGRDAAFVAIGTADLSTIDDRGYREAQLDSGIVEGRLHLAAYALGLGATGMTFIDTEIEPLLREPLGALLFTCVGVQPYRTTAGGRPGAPVDVVARTAGITEASGG